MNNHIKEEPIAGACGAEVLGVDLSQELDDATFGEIRQAFHDHQVIFFRDQKLTEDQHKAFGRRFGTLNIHPRYEPLEGHPEIFPIRKDPQDVRNVGDVWHHDLTHLPCPPLGAILYALETPAVGGDTLFASQYDAYESLSDGLKRTLEGLKGVHDNRIQSPKVTADRNAERTSKLRIDPDAADEPECEEEEADAGGQLIVIEEDLDPVGQPRVGDQGFADALALGPVDADLAPPLGNRSLLGVQGPGWDCVVTREPGGERRLGCHLEVQEVICGTLE